MTSSTPEYTATRKQWLLTMLSLLACREDDKQDELFREALILFNHMGQQKWEDE